MNIDVRTMLGKFTWKGINAFLFEIKEFLGDSPPFHFEILLAISLGHGQVFTGCKKVHCTDFSDLG